MLPCAFLESQHLLPSERLYFCNYVECMLGRFNYVQLFVIQWTVTCQAPLSMGFSRQEFWGALLLPTFGDLPDLGIEPMSPAAAASAGRFFTTSAT